MRSKLLVNIHIIGIILTNASSGSRFGSTSKPEPKSPPPDGVYPSSPWTIGEVRKASVKLGLGGTTTKWLLKVARNYKILMNQPS